MAPQLDNTTIRNSSPTELARYLQTQLHSASWQPISDHLIASVASGSVPPSVFQVWLSVCKDANAIAAALHQDASVLVRHVAMRRVGKLLRKDGSFSAMWTALGETKGLVDLMASFSVDEVGVMCETIGFSSAAIGAVKLRQQAVSELYDALRGVGSVQNPDTRPLASFYRHLLPACTVETSLDYTNDRSPSRKICQVHSDTYEKRALQDIFLTQGSDKNIVVHKNLLERSRPFAIHVLERFASNDTALQKNVDVFVGCLATPLMRRTCHKRIKDGSQELILELIVECAEKEPKIADGIHWGQGGLLFYSTQIWKRSRNESRDRVEKLLVRLIRAMPQKKSSNLSSVSMIMRRVQPVLRYRLLRILLRNLRWYALDIESETAENDKKLKDIGELWPVSLFMDLHRQSALKLFERLTKLHSDGKFIHASGAYGQNTIIYATSVGERHVDPDIIHAFLASRTLTRDYSDEQPMWLDRANKGIAERKNKAAFSREWEDRANWAESALKLAIATGSLDIYGETLLWARRFNRDAQTAQLLYRASNVLTEEGLELLSGVPYTDVNGPMELLGDTSTRIKKANEIIIQLLETAAMGIQEPSFNWSHWNSVLGVIPNSIFKRLERTQCLQEKYRQTDSDIYETIWAPTIEMLLRAELFGLGNGNERLVFNSVGGPLCTWEAITPAKSTCNFLDMLAQKRNELWNTYRSTVHPTTMTLGKPWPRGLAIQDLLPKLKLPNSLPPLPYVQSRAKDVVFVGVSVLTPVPSDEEQREAIGTFVEDYGFALQLYLAGAKDNADRDACLRQAWKHATTVLTGDRMSVGEAVPFWKSIFTDTDSDLGLDLERLNLAPGEKGFLPHLPADDRVESPSEWDPYQNSGASQTTTRQLPETCLDCMLQPGSSSWSPWSPRLKNITTPFTTKTSRTVVAEPSDIWSLHSYPVLLPPFAKDSLAAAAVVYINKYGSDNSLLLKPFPSQDDVRFPALYLDQDFLERTSKKTSVEEPLEVLAHLSSNVPTQLLVQLASSLLTRLNNDTKEDPGVREATMKIIKRLARGDRPGVACKFLQKIVLDRQDDSSWHRHLFNVGFLRRLSARDAKSFFGGLSRQIQARLEKQAGEQAKRRAEKQDAKEGENQAADEGPVLAGQGVAQGAARGSGLSPRRGIPGANKSSSTLGPPPGFPAPLGNITSPPGFGPSTEAATKKAENKFVPPYIKVTTVKMVAQMLRDANYVDQPFACDILVGLFKGSTHPDIQVAIVESLLSMLVNTKDEKLQAIIYEAFENHVVSIAASMNERRPITEENWLAAESGEGFLPEVYAEEPMIKMPPILHMLVSALAQWKSHTPEYREWASRILIPIAEKSAANNARWNAIFARCYGFDIPQDYLPVVPVKPGLLMHLWTYVPEAFTRLNFETLKRYSVANLWPHDSIAAANKAVKKDGDLLKSNAGKHWLFLWENKDKDAFSLGINQIINSLRLMELHTPVTHEIKIQEVQAFLISIAESFILYGQVAKFKTFYETLGQSVADYRHIWIANCLPILQHFIKRIDQLRTEEWQHNLKRTPARLPDTFKIKQRILRTKHEHVKSDPPSQKAVSDFTADVSALINELITDDAPYHDQWPVFSRMVRSAICSWHWVRIGVALADPQSLTQPIPKLADHLKIEIADDMFRNAAQDQDEDLVKKAREVLKGWVESPVERIRIRGQTTVNLLREMRNGWFGKEELLE
ncbi:hypothetical protein BJ170DRAFT_686166 [Xylariales sp. AK1849]|nr:hypothetical protein BJ170DRAFT_686166 [Xylariales sp. AK1849]